MTSKNGRIAAGLKEGQRSVDEIKHQIVYSRLTTRGGLTGTTQFAMNVPVDNKTCDFGEMTELSCSKSKAVKAQMPWGPGGLHVSTPTGVVMEPPGKCPPYSILMRVSLAERAF